MAWVGVAVAGASLIGGALSAGAQSGAAQTAANAQTQASQQQAQTQAAATNAQWAAEGPTRALGGYAQSELAYLMGLTPNLNTSMDFTTPQVNTDGTVSYVPSTNIGGAGATTSPVGSRGPIGRYPGMGGTFGINTSRVHIPTGPAAGATTPNAPATGHPLNGMGYGALATNPMSNPSNLVLNPDYQFVLGTNESLINNQLAAAGHGAASTGGLETAMNYGTGLATTTYQQAFDNAMRAQQQTYNELAALSGEGQVATSAGNQALQSGSAGISAAQGAAGSAQAAGAIGGANAFTSGIGTALSGLNTGLSMYTLSNQQSPYAIGSGNIQAPNLASEINAVPQYNPAWSTPTAGLQG